MPTSDNGCPACGELVRGDLVYHFWVHLQRKRQVWPPEYNRLCVCGEAFQDTEAGRRRFFNHVAERGGLHGHLIAAGLGINDAKREQ